MKETIDLRQIARDYKGMVLFRDKNNDQWVKEVLDQAEAQGFHVVAALGMHRIRGYHLMCGDEAGKGEERLSIMLSLEGDWIKGYPTWETDGGIKLVESEEET
jgi:hypothetical protein